MQEGAHIASLIGGKRESGSGRFQLRDKYLGTHLAEVEIASAANVDQAATLAAEAMRKGALPPAQRHQIMSTASHLLRERRDRFAETMTAEAGFTATDSANEVDRAVLTLSLCAEEARRLVGDMVPLGASAGQEGRVAFTLRVPIGIVCAITPFNSPLNVVAHKIGPALAAGNAVILKPSGFTPLTAMMLAELLIEAGLPAELIAVLHDPAGEAAQALLAEPRISFYTFTGSTRVGRIIQRAAGLRRTQLELGSIASTIVCQDADLDIALPKVVNAAFRKAGQVCTSVQRIYIHRAIWPEALERLAALTAGMTAGDPRAQSTRVGPMISIAAADRVAQLLEDAVGGGAEIRSGGERCGAVFTPTLLTGTAPGMAITEQENFGPLLSAIPFDALPEVFDAANATPYGLAIGVFTHDIPTALAAAGRLRFGAVHINETSSARADAMPFGGVKDSGFGREGPGFAIREYTEERLITIRA